MKQMNTPNKLTLLRVIMIPFFVVFMLADLGSWSKWAALIVFVVASMTDWLDGYLARRDHLVTDFGKFMDPLADKLLVCSALICLTDMDRIPSWVVIIIIGREFIISGFRLVAADNGVGKRCLPSGAGSDLRFAAADGDFPGDLSVAEPEGAVHAGIGLDSVAVRPNCCGIRPAEPDDKGVKEWLRS